MKLLKLAKSESLADEFRNSVVRDAFVGKISEAEGAAALLATMDERKARAVQVAASKIWSWCRSVFCQAVRRTNGNEYSGLGHYWQACSL